MGDSGSKTTFFSRWAVWTVPVSFASAHCLISITWESGNWHSFRDLTPFILTQEVCELLHE